MCSSPHFELFILQRPGAEKDYTPEVKAAAKTVYEQMSQAEIDYIIMVIASALPGSTTEPMTIPAFRDKLDQYRDIDATRLRQHLIEFLAAVTPIADQLGVKLTLHPDDPPRSLFGLPRIASTAADYQALFDAVPSRPMAFASAQVRSVCARTMTCPPWCGNLAHVWVLPICGPPSARLMACPSTNQTIWMVT